MGRPIIGHYESDDEQLCLDWLIMYGLSLSADGEWERRNADGTVTHGFLRCCRDKSLKVGMWKASIYTPPPRETQP